MRVVLRVSTFIIFSRSWRANSRNFVFKCSRWHSLRFFMKSARINHRMPQPSGSLNRCGLLHNATGVVSDRRLGKVVTGLGKEVADSAHRPMPSHVRPKDVAALGRNGTDGGYQSSLTDVSESPIDSRFTSGTFSSSSSLSSPCAESSQEGSQNIISRASKELQPESRVSDPHCETPLSQLPRVKQERKSAKFLKLLRSRH